MVKTKQIRKAKAFYSGLAKARAPLLHVFLADSKADRGVRELYREKREGFGYALNGDYWHELTRRGISCVIG